LLKEEMQRLNETVELTVKYLLSVRDTTGRREEQLSLPEGSTLQDLSELLQKRYGLTVPSRQIMATLNGRGWSQFPQGTATRLTQNDVVCMFPPVSGG
jgi:molybdopterin converting factor small subunit